MAISLENNNMIEENSVTQDEIIPNKHGKPIGNDKLLSISDIADILGVCPVTASMVMKDSGRSRYCQ